MQPIIPVCFKLVKKVETSKNKAIADAKKDGVQRR